MHQCTCVVVKVVYILAQLMGCGCCVECRHVPVRAMQHSTEGVHNNLKLYMLHFEHAACVLLY